MGAEPLAAVLTMFVAFRRSVISRALLASMALLYVVFAVWVVLRRLA